MSTIGSGIFRSTGELLQVRHAKHRVVMKKARRGMVTIRPANYVQVPLAIDIYQKT